MIPNLTPAELLAKQVQFIANAMHRLAEHPDSSEEAINACHFLAQELGTVANSITQLCSPGRN